MATYYVIPQVGGASDSNAGTKASPWLTIGKAATTMVAGDTVYIAGDRTYRELVTPTNSGSSGSVISYIADITGANTGYGGSVIISAFDSNSAAPVRNYCLNQNGKKFVTWQGVVFNGCTGTSNAAVYSSTGSGDNFEGVTFENCVMIGYTGGNALNFLCGAATTPTDNGLAIDKCTLVGRFYIDYAESASAEQNFKMSITNSLFVCATRSNSLYQAVYFNRATASTYGVGGLNIYNCDFFGNDTGVYFNTPRSTTYPCSVRNSRFMGISSNCIQTLSASAGAVKYSNNRFNSALGATTGTITDEGGNDSSSDIMLIGGIADMPLRNALGYSPFAPWEPMRSGDGTSLNDCIDKGSLVYASTADIYGNPRKMGRASPFAHEYYFNASDDAVSDPNSAWLSEANIFDSSSSSVASCGTGGSASSNYVFAGGTNAPSSGGTIAKVQTRIAYAGSSSASRTVGWEIRTDAWDESLGSFTQVMTSSTLAWSDWADLTAPSAGWTWAKVQALEVRIWEVTSSANITIGMVEIGVITEDPAIDIGAVEARTRLAKESTTIRSGSFAGNFTGAGFHDFWTPVDASSTTISTYAQYDSNYVGNKPKLEVFNIPGVADQSDTMSGSTNTWEQLSITFTPSAAGVVRVRISSQDASTNGKCFFDDMGR